MAPDPEGAGLAGRSRSAASSLSTASAVDRPVNMDGITLCGMGSQERTQLRRSGRVATPQRSPPEARRSGCSVLQHHPDLPMRERPHSNTALRFRLLVHVPPRNYKLGISSSGRLLLNLGLSVSSVLRAHS